MSFDALASDLSGLSAKYGRRVDAFIGYSFLQDEIILIDYPGRMSATSFLRLKMMLDYRHRTMTFFGDCR